MTFVRSIVGMVDRIQLSRAVQWHTARSGQGIDVALPPSASNELVLISDTFKSHIFRIWAKFSASNQFVDVGANIGQTMLEVLPIKRGLEYYGFEPNVSAFSIAKELALSNNLSVNLFPWACSSEAQPLELYASSLLDTSATFFPSIRPNTYSKVAPDWIAAYPLDLTLGSVLRHGFMLKIDVEGSENEVLMGASRLLQQKRPLILCEVLHAHRKTEIGANNWRKKELLKLLMEFCYTLYRVDLDPKDREKFIGISKVERFPMNCIWKESPHTCDYLFIPEEVPLQLLLNAD